MNYPDLPLNQKYFIIVAGLFLLGIVIELVRRRKMLEQYSVLWIVIGVCAATFIWLYPFIQRITVVIGAGFTTSTILFGAVFILLLIVLQLCVKISEFSYTIKDLVQEVAILNDELAQLRNASDQTTVQEIQTKTKKPKRK